MQPMLTTTATNNYTSTLTNSQQSMGERLGFEYVAYNSSSPATLIVYIINSGSANSVQINSLFLYDSNNRIVGVYSVSGGSISALQPIDSSMPTPISGLNVRKEAYFTVTLGKDTSGKNIFLSPGSVYTIQLITKSGSAFDYEFTP